MHICHLIYFPPKIVVFFPAKKKKKKKSKQKTYEIQQKKCRKMFPFTKENEPQIKTLNKNERKCFLPYVIQEC